MLRKQLGGVGPRSIVVMVVLAGIVGAATAFAGSDQRKGTAGASELQIPAGPRSTALGGAVVGDVGGIEAMFWNPAGLGGLEATEVAFSHTQYFADMKFNYAGIVTKAGNLGSLGVGVRVLSIGDVFVTTEQSPDGTGEVLTPTFSVLGLTWGKQFTDRVNFGVTANYVHEEVANTTANGVAFDFGAQYLTDWRGFRFGMVAKNIGTKMEFSGPGFEIPGSTPGSDPNAVPRTVSFSSAGFEMPSSFVLSSSMNAMKNPTNALMVMAAYQNNNFSGDQMRLGTEWAYRSLVALRASYFGTFNGTTDLTGDETFSFDSGDDLYEGFALGAGFGTRLGDTGTIGVDLAWRPVKEGFDDILEVGLRVKF